MGGLEVRRIFLGLGLAVSAYLLILAWTSQPDQKHSQRSVSISDTPAIETSITNQTTHIPKDSTNPLLASETDIPVLQPQEKAGFSAKPSRVDASRLVKVETNVLNVWIDLMGGDMVRVELVQYPQSMDEGSPPIHLLTRSSDQIYVAQSGLIGDGPDSGDKRPLYKAERNGLVLRDKEGELVLTTDYNGLEIKKIFAFNPDDYLINVGYEVKNISSENFVAGMFAQIKRDSNLPQRDESLFFAPNPYLGGATTTDETRYEKISFEDVNEGKKSFSKQGGWIGFLQHYFLTAWIPQEKESNRFESLRSADDTYIFRTVGSTKQIAPLQTGRWSSGFYAGPKNQIVLAEISENLNMTVDYGFLWWIAEPLFGVLNYFHEVTGNWGAAIILLTVFVKAALFWFSHKGYHSMANLRRVAPAMKRLQERYANDREKLSKEMMALYQKEGANPLGGCLPMLLPMPIFLALYWVLLESVELRHTPFILWIDDLSAMDPYFVLPLLMGASTYLMQALNPQVGDPMQQKIMKIMPVMFTVLFLFFPAGLVLYWLVNNLISIAHQTYVYKLVERKTAKTS